MTIKEMAKEFGVARNAYNRYEFSHEIPTQEEFVDDLKPWEKAAILRRRKNWTQEQVANFLGCSRLWVNKMEQGKESPEILLKMWKLA